MVAAVIVFVFGILMGFFVKRSIIDATHVLTGYMYYRKQKEDAISTLLAFLKVKEQYAFYKTQFIEYPRTFMQYIGFINKHITAEKIQQTYVASLKDAVVTIIVVTLFFIGLPFFIFQELYLYFFIGALLTLVYEYVYGIKVYKDSHMFTLSMQILKTMNNEWLRLHPPKEASAEGEPPATTPGNILQEEIVLDAAIFKTKLFKYIRLMAIAGSVLFVASIISIFLVAIFLSNSKDDSVFTDALIIVLFGYVLFMIALFLIFIISAIASGVHSLLNNTKK